MLLNKATGPKQNSQNRLRLPMPEGGEPNVFLNNAMQYKIF
jgi:hypothetical protein